MSRFTRFLTALLPDSVPPHLQARCLAAMEGRTLSPAPSVCGEAALGAGQTPEDETSADRAHPVVSSSGPPPCETDLFWEPQTADTAFDLSPGRIGHLIDRWNTEAHA